MITLCELKEEIPHGLLFVDGSERALPRLPIAGVHISELTDPTQYLSGGEFLLTTGMALTDNQEVADAYVQRLILRKVCALGFGIGPVWEKVPQTLVRACRQYHLELLVIPDSVPFQHMTRAYWKLTLQGGTADLERSLDLQAALAREVTRPDGVRTVVRQLAQSLGGWVIFSPQGYGTEVLWPASAESALNTLRTIPEKIKRSDVNAVMSFEIKGQMVLKFPVAAGDQIYGYLAVCPARRLVAADKQVINTVCALLMMKVRQQQSYSAGLTALGDAVVRLLANGHEEAARLLSENVGLGELPSRLHVLAVIGSEKVDSTEWLRAVPTLERAAGIPVLDQAVATANLIHRMGNTLVVLLPEKIIAASNQPKNGAGFEKTTIAAVLTDPVPLAEIPAAIASARRATRRAPHGHIIRAGSRDRNRAEEWVTTLEQYRRADLLSTVAAYVRNRGQWEPTSRELGMHRNSVRHRIETAEELLGVDLNDPNVFAPLWIALRDRVGEP